MTIISKTTEINYTKFIKCCEKLYSISYAMKKINKTDEQTNHCELFLSIRLISSTQYPNWMPGFYSNTKEMRYQRYVL